MKYLLNWNFVGEANEALLPSRVHFVICLIERGFISKVNSWRLILASTIFKLKSSRAKKTGISEVLIFILELVSEVKSDCLEILAEALVYGDF